MTDGALYRTKIHCYFLDQTRVIRPLPDEKNYHIFYQMLAGLSHEERGKGTSFLIFPCLRRCIHDIHLTRQSNLTWRVTT